MGVWVFVWVGFVSIKLAQASNGSITTVISWRPKLVDRREYRANPICEMAAKTHLSPLVCCDWVVVLLFAVVV